MKFGIFGLNTHAIASISHCNKCACRFAMVFHDAWFFAVHQTFHKVSKEASCLLSFVTNVSQDFYRFS